MAMAQSAKPMPQLNQQSTKQLNLTVLQRMDKDIEEILTTAGHVTFYEFNMDLNQWSRKDVEGSLFVVKRKAQPRFQFIVMNRRSTDNLVEDLLGSFEYEVQVPYLLYRNQKQEVNGIWFYNQRECEEVANLFSRILSAYSKMTPKNKLISQPSNEFLELEGVPSAAIVEGPLEPTTTVTEEPLERFFNSSLQIGGQDAPSSAPSRSAGAIPVMRSSANVSPVPLPSMSSVATVTQEPAESTTIAPSMLVKPSFFTPAPPSSGFSQPLAPPVLQPSHGAPLLQPFPPPAPPPSLTPLSIPTLPAISRDGVKDALLRLVQSDHFIDMIYREMLNAHSK